MASSKYNSTSFRPFGADVPKEVKEEKVEKFHFNDWAKEGRPTYSEIKETFEKNLPKKDQRFFLSELVANQLSVEEEDSRRFEARIKDELEKKVAEIKEIAYREGYEQGLEKGIEKAFAEERVHIAARLEAMAAITSDLVESKAKLEFDYEKKLTEYAFQLAESIVESEIQNRPESVSMVIRNILELLSKEEDVKIHLGIANKAQVDYIRDEIAKVNRKGSYVIEFRDDFAPGDCSVESISGEVSAKISERIAAFRAEIMNRFHQSEDKKAV
ncbi:MAG TPA: FliH/SctL family protein [Bdellovibrionota bacterium]|nr:FliH/SctL family protein [Bdellovibrionota bacterium]